MNFTWSKFLCHNILFLPLLEAPGFSYKGLCCVLYQCNCHIIASQIYFYRTLVSEDSLHFLLSSTIQIHHKPKTEQALSSADNRCYIKENITFLFFLISYFMLFLKILSMKNEFHWDSKKKSIIGTSEESQRFLYFIVCIISASIKTHLFLRQ